MNKIIKKDKKKFKEDILINMKRRNNLKTKTKKLSN